MHLVLRSFCRLLRRLLRSAFIIALLLCCTGCNHDTSAFGESDSHYKEGSLISSQTDSDYLMTHTAFDQTEVFPYPFTDKLAMSETAPRELLITAEEALYDYDTMWELLRENYPFFSVIRDEIGIDPLEVQEEYRKKLEHSCVEGQLKMSVFIERINECLSCFQNIGHLYIFKPFYRDDFIQRLSGEDGKYGNLSGLMANSKTEQLYTIYRTQLNELNVNSSDNSVKYDTNAPEELDLVDTIEPGIEVGYSNGIPYIHLSMLYGWTSNTEEKIYRFLSDNQDSSNLILDIRGNGGGSSLAWQFVVSALTTETLSYEFIFGYLEGSLNLWTDPDLKNQENFFQYIYTDDSWKKELSSSSWLYLQKMDKIAKLKSYINPATNSVHFKGRVWLLVDNEVASAADEFTQFCKQSGFATVIGTTTGGNGVGLQSHVMALPWSGLLIYYEPFIGFNSDGTCNALVGTAPDYPIQSTDDALSICLELIMSATY